MSKPRRQRTARRELERQLEKTAIAAERIFGRSAGGNPDSPLPVESVAVIEVRAKATPCPRCGGEHDVLEHRAVTVEGARLREVHMACKGCRSRRSLWFSLPVVN